MFWDINLTSDSVDRRCVQTRTEFRLGAGAESIPVLETAVTNNELLSQPPPGLPDRYPLGNT